MRSIIAKLSARLPTLIEFQMKTAKEETSIKVIMN